MGVFEQITVNVPADAAEAMRRSVRAGEYATESELLGDLLREWADARDAGEVEVAHLRRLVAEADDGRPTIPAEQVFADLRARITARMNER